MMAFHDPPTLPEYEALVQSLFTNIRDVYYRTDLQGRLLLVSPSVLQVTGYTPDEMQGRAVQEFDVDPSRYGAFRDRLAADGVVNDFEVEIVVRDGRVVPVSISAHLLRDAEGQPSAIEGILRDIRERKALEEAVRDREAHLQLIINNTLDVLYTVETQNATITYISPAVTRWGMSPDDVVGRHIAEFLHPDDLAGVLQNLQTTVTTGQEFLTQFRVVTPHGHVVPVEEFGKAIWRDGQVVQITGVLRDITERKRTEEALRESEQKFSVLYHKAPFAIALSTLADGVIVDVNETFEKVFGYTREEVVGKTSVELGINLDPEQRARILADLQQRGFAREIEGTFCTRSGRGLVFSNNLDVVEFGGQKYLFSTVQDITERRRAEVALQAHIDTDRHFTARLRTLHDVCNALADTETHTTFLRQAVAWGQERLGFERLSIWLVDAQHPDSIVGTFGIDEQGQVRDEGGHCLRVTSDSTMGHVLAHAETVIVHDTPLLNHCAHIIGTGDQAIAPICDGQRIIGCMSCDTALTGQPLTAQHGDILTLYADSVGHLYRLKQTKATLRQVNEQLSAIIVASPVAMIVCDLDGQVMRWNPAAERMFGWHASEVIGRPHPIVPPDKWGEFRTLLDQAMREGAFHDVEVCRQKRDGTPIDLRISAATLHDEQGNLLGIVGILADITAQKQAHAQERRLWELQEAERLKAEFLSLISHELKSPLTPILGAVDLLSTETLGPLTTSQVDGLRMIKRQAKRLQRLMDDLLDLFRLESGHLSLHSTTVDLRSLIADCQAVYAPRFAEKGLALQCVSASELPSVWGDAQRLAQVLDNLVGNALKYTDAGGVAMRAFTVDDAVRVEVTDTGIGLTPEQIDHVFLRFYQVGHGRQGAGLGLAIVKQLVEAHGGSVWVESDGLGQGCTVVLLLPTTRSDAEE